MLKISFLSLALMLSLGAVGALAQTPAPAMKSTAPAMAPAMKSAPAMAPAMAAGLMDINSATTDQLATLKGIGPVRAAAIVKGRPYRGKDELVQKGILTQGVYDPIKDQIIAKQK
jgi:competence protein ComEA